MQGGSIREMLKPRSEWKKDNEATNCFACGREFLPIVRWRHHCRFCGNIFCSKCVDNILLGEQIGYKQERRLRHCDQCHERIKKALTGDALDYTHKSEMYDANDHELKIDLEETTDLSMSVASVALQGEDAKREKIVLEELSRSCEEDLARLSLALCEKHGVEVPTWQRRLCDLAIRTANEVAVDTLVRNDYFSLLREVRIVTIVAPKESVTAACVKGLILERNIPSKQLPTHLKYPNILLFKPAIQAEGLMQNEAKFDQMVKNQNTILRNYLQKIYRLKPNVIFVAEHVSKVAFEDFLENGIMVLSKVKPEDLRAIQRLALIRKMIDHLHFIDKYRPVDVIGVCEKIYFKSIRQGEMIMVIEQEGGMRSVLLGDSTEELNARLKAVFAMLLRVAWRLKRAREVVAKDLRFNGQDERLVPILLDCLDCKGLSVEKLHLALEVQGTKIIYRHGKAEELQKPFEQYCLKLGHSTFMQQCHQSVPLPTYFRTRCYDGEDLMLGTYLLKIIAGLFKPCKKCNSAHAERYFMDGYYVTIKMQTYNDRMSKAVKEEQEEEEGAEEGPLRPEPVLVHESILRHFQHFKEKMVFFLFFRCDGCSEIIGSTKIKLGKQYLSISFLHYLSELVEGYKRKKTSSEQKQQPCEHGCVSRVIQCSRALIKFTVGEYVINKINTIEMGQGQQLAMLARDQKYLIQIYRRELTEKWLILGDLEAELMRMPFSASITASIVSSISGVPPHEHPLFGSYLRVSSILGAMREKLGEIESTYLGYFTQPLHDWTIVMRKFYKIEHILKVLYDIIHFIANSLKKEKIEETASIEDHLQFAEVQRINRIRKDSQQQDQIRGNNSPLMGSPQVTAKLHSSQSMISLVASLRKDTGGTELEQIDDIFKKSRKQRFPLYQGTCLYYPIGSTSDPVSLLACCLNSEEFGETLKEQPARDCMTVRMNFARQLQTKWAPNEECERVYKETLREDYPKNEVYEYTFSIYYHREFEELRLSEGIGFPLYIRSLYGCQSWDSSGGKSNSTFSKSHNQLLVVKIINEKQFVEFQKFALAYLKYMRAKRETKEQSYLAKIYGIYQATIRNKVYKFVVMQNIFLGVSGPMKVYDLKGSEVNRLAVPSGSKAYTGLDTNFIFDKDGRPYILQEGVFERTMRTYEEDAAFLRDQSVIDYSLLVIESQKTLRMGIIDFMRPYHLIEKIENKYKEMMSGKDPTVIEPNKYAERFVNALKRYFIKVPSD